MTEDDRGWGKLLDFMVSGSPGSFVLWAILAYGVWSTFHTNWRDRDGGDGGWFDGDGDGGDGGD